jgi:hypothetical protein
VRDINIIMIIILKIITQDRINREMIKEWDKKARLNTNRGGHLSMNTRITEEKILRKMIILSGNSKINKNAIAQNTAETNFMSSLIREIKPN